MNPSVTLNAPPYTPMSSPRRKTRSSRSISSHRASAMATRYVAWPSSVRLPRGSAPCPAAPASTFSCRSACFERSSSRWARPSCPSPAPACLEASPGDACGVSAPTRSPSPIELPSRPALAGWIAAPIAVVREHAERGLGRIGQRGVLRVFEPLLELLFDPLLDLAHAVLVQDSLRDQELGEVLHRVVEGHVFLEHGLGDV